MKQTAVEWLQEQLKDVKYNPLEKNGYSIAKEKLFNQAKEMEKEQIIEAGNSCAFKQHLHSDRMNKMTMDELEQYNLESSYTFGEEHYNETFKNK